MMNCRITQEYKRNFDEEKEYQSRKQMYDEFKENQADLLNDLEWELEYYHDKE